MGRTRDNHENEKEPGGQLYVFESGSHRTASDREAGLIVMTTAFGRPTTKAVAIALFAAVLVPGIAGAVVLPERGPIPTERPTVQAASAIQIPLPARDVVSISTVKQDIPDARRDVRIVGANFLPPADETIDFASVNEQFSIAGKAENFVMEVVTNLFDRSDDEAPLQVAGTASQVN